MNRKPAPPFALTYTPSLSELLHQLQCSLVLSTYQTGKVITISPVSEDKLVQFPRTFKRPMGIALQGDRLAIATEQEVIVLNNAPGLAKAYPNKSDLYDALFLPAATYYTGSVDMHDLHWGADGELWAVNTSFSCLCRINDRFSFEPVWQPPFISALVAEDRCHMNGLAMDEQGRPKYITALGTGDSKQSWREKLPNGGVIMDIKSNSIISQDLAMPHSPRIYDGKLYCLLSAEGACVEVDINTGKYTEICKVDGFARGMTKCDDYLFITTSKLRKNASTFKHLKIAEKSTEAAIWVVHLPSGAIVGKLVYHATVDEIYDILVMPDIIRPNILNTINDAFRLALYTPEHTYWAQLKDEEKS